MVWGHEVDEQKGERLKNGERRMPGVKVKVELHKVVGGVETWNRHALDSVIVVNGIGTPLPYPLSDSAEKQ